MIWRLNKSFLDFIVVVQTLDFKILNFYVVSIYLMYVLSFIDDIRVCVLYAMIFLMIKAEK
jgi:hypothetical protein